MLKLSPRHSLDSALPVPLTQCWHRSHPDSNKRADKLDSDRHPCNKRHPCHKVKKFWLILTMGTWCGDSGMAKLSENKLRDRKCIGCQDLTRDKCLGEALDRKCRWSGNRKCIWEREFFKKMEIKSVFVDTLFIQFVAQQVGIILNQKGRMKLAHI